MSYTIKQVFVTLQGEGGRAGQRSVFIRFAGCNLWNGKPEDREKGAGACAGWCDTDFFGGDKLDLAALLANAEDAWGTVGGQKWAVLSGGEPTLQVDTPLIEAFHAAGWLLAMETNGTRTAPRGVDWVTVSPKRGAPVVQTTGAELKVVLPGEATNPGWTDAELLQLAANGQWGRKYVQAQDPIVPALLEASHLRKRTLGARWEFEANMKRCTDFVLAHPDWALSFQVHKVINLP